MTLKSTRLNRTVPLAPYPCHLANRLSRQAFSLLPQQARPLSASGPLYICLKAFLYILTRAAPLYHLNTLKTFPSEVFDLCLKLKPTPALPILLHIYFP